MTFGLRRATPLLALAALPACAQSAPKLSYNLFGDVRYIAQDTARDPATPSGRSHAALGQLVFMAQGSLDDHWSAFAEAVLEYNPDIKTTGVDLERFYVEYQANDLFTAGLGKRHTPLGYWNNAFHHGNVFQPTINRPLLVEFEDGGGLQPAHDTGLWFRGRAGEAGWFGYDVMSSNGQTGNQESDANAHKAFTAHVEGKGSQFALGLSFRSDLLAANADLNARPGTVTRDTDVTFAGADFRIDHPRFKIIGEYMQIKEKDSLGDATNNGWFIYAGIPIEAWTPYLLIQGAHIDPLSRVFSGFEESQKGQVAGIKYQFESSIVFKAEAHRTDLSASKRTERQIIFAVAFGF